MADPFAIPAEPPYTYNDPRIIYNEPCFFYNGGYDLICLFGTPPPAGRGVATGARVKSKPQPETISLIFKSCICRINDDVIDINKREEEYCELKKYVFKKDLDVVLKLEQITLKGKRLTFSSKLLDSKVLKKHLSGSSEGVSSKKTKVLGSLILNEPRKINFISSILKKKNKDTDKEE